MLTIGEYDNLAVKAIHKFASEDWKQRMLNDDEVLGEVGHAMMKADAKFQPDRGMTKSSFRFLKAKYAIFDLIGKLSKEADRPDMPDDAVDPRAKCPLDMMDNSEQVQLLMEKLPPVQFKCISAKYFEGMNQSQIASAFQIFPSSVARAVNDGINNMRQACL